MFLLRALCNKNKTSLASLHGSNENDNNVTRIKDAGFCTGCGTCAGVCPSSAIEIERDSHGTFLPVIDSKKCTRCTFCLRICPAYLTDSKRLSDFVFGKSSNDTSIGIVINCYIGYSVEEKVLLNASSGGVVTSLLLFSIKNQLIDGALVTKMRKDKPLESEMIIARAKKDVVESAGSKYCPTSMSAAIKTIRSQEGKFAVVGLPCQIKGIRKAEMLDEKLRDKIAIHIGLFCSHTVNFIGTDLLLRRMGICRDDIVSLRYRGGGWPGDMSVKLRNGNEIKLPYRDYWNGLFGAFFFTPVCCTVCADATNELADLSVGDPWLPELRVGHEGWSLVVVRTEVGQRYLDLARDYGYLHTQRIHSSAVKTAQLYNLIFKKRALGTRIHFLHSLKRTKYLVPSQFADWNVRYYLSTFLVYLNIRASSSRRVQSFLKYAPLGLLKIYFKFVCASILLV